MAGITSQERARIVGGALVFAGTVALGKIVVENILRERAERFDARKAPPAARAAKESTMDGIVKLGGTVYSLYLMGQLMPGLLKEAQRLLE